MQKVAKKSRKSDASTHKLAHPRLIFGPTLFSLRLIKITTSIQVNNSKIIGGLNRKFRFDDVAADFPVPKAIVEGREMVCANKCTYSKISTKVILGTPPFLLGKGIGARSDI
jgi:hypothetical protein